MDCTVFIYQFGVNCYSNSIWYSNPIQIECLLIWGGEGVLISANTVLKFSVYSCFPSNVKFIPVLFLFRAIVNELHFQMVH